MELAGQNRTDVDSERTGGKGSRRESLERHTGTGGKGRKGVHGLDRTEF